MRVLKVSADYQCYPLWDATPGEFGNIDPRDLPISSELAVRLINWARRFDATLNEDDPVSSGFNSNEDEIEFCNEGRELEKLLQIELGVEYSVILGAQLK